MADEQKFADEIMSDEELDQVAGGNYAETSLDSQFLNALNGSCGIYMPNDCLGGAHDAEIAAAWKSVGVSVVLDSGNKTYSYRAVFGGGGNVSHTNPGTPNVYMIPDASGGLIHVTRNQAIQYAMDYVKSHS